MTGQHPDDSAAIIRDDPDCARVCGDAVHLRITQDDAARIAAMFKALSHPVRLQIMDILSRYGGQVCVCEIERHFDLRQPTISHHLKVLRSSGMIAAEQRGLWVYYYILPEALAPAEALLRGLTGQDDGE